MRHSFLRSLAPPILALLVVGCGPTHLGTVRPERQRMPVPPRIDPEEAVASLIQEHNQIRLEKGLRTLSPSPRLQAAALAHAQDMAGQRKMSHEGSDGSSTTDRFTRVGYRYRRAGENVAYGQWSVDEVMRGWMNSPVHKANILGSFSQIGAACATAEDGKTYWCVTFGQAMR
jgi:uncharacterized protein YkwD